MKKEQIELSYRIVKIHTTKFSFNEISELDLSNLLNTKNGLNIKIDVTLTINKEHNKLAIEVFSNLINPNGEVLVEHKGKTEFDVKGMDAIYNKENKTFDYPDVFLTQIYGIAYTHARALLATDISPTIYRDKYFLPVIDPLILLPPKKSVKKSE